MRLTEVNSFSYEDIENLSRSRLYDAYKFIKGYGSIKSLATEFGYSSQQSIWKICKGEGIAKRNNKDVLNYMREAIYEYINKNKILKNQAQKTKEVATVNDDRS